jgi:sensor histidine kinase YesM
MDRYPFIFSNQLRYRLLRHFTFWFCWWAFSSFLYAYTLGIQVLPSLKRLPISAVEAFIFLSIHIFISYALVYFVVPHLLIKGKYLASITVVILLFLATGVLNAFIVRYVLEDARDFLLSNLFGWEYRVPRRIVPASFYLSLLAGLRGGITVAGMAASIKLMKYWYVKEQRNLQLQRENAAAQVQLLKAQVQPHFLFNTLNNIYSFTQTTSPVAAKLVMGLSDLLRYILYAGSQSKVLLSKELKMVQDYMTLEQVRYGDRLDMHLKLPARTDNLLIAPLLLLPLVENCFKHGASHMLEQPWISLHIEVEENSMSMKLVNGKPSHFEPPKETTGIGLENVQKRLELLYPERHTLKITNEEEVFIVDLKVDLEKEPIDTETPTHNLTIAHA